MSGVSNAAIEAAALAMARIETGDDGVTFANDIDRIHARAALEAAAPIIRTDALSLDELDWVMRYLMRAELKEGLLLADMLNQRFGASARRRGSAWPVASG